MAGRAPSKHARPVGGPASRPISAGRDPRVGGQYHSPICRPLTSGESGFGPVRGRVASAEAVRSSLLVTTFAPKAVRGTRLPPLHLPLSLTSPHVRPLPRPVNLHAVLPPHQPATVSRHPGQHVSATSSPYGGPTMTSC